MSGELGHMIDINILYTSVGQLGGWMAGQNNILYPPPQGDHTHHIMSSSMLMVRSVGNKPIDLLLDSDAAVSVIHHKVLPH